MLPDESGFPYTRRRIAHIPISRSDGSIFPAIQCSVQTIPGVDTGKPSLLAK
jgi:hypothetical protein